MTSPKSGRPRRPRGTPEKAEADIMAAIDRLTSQWADGAGVNLTASQLAHEAGMSRKQLYTYFASRPHLAGRWSEAAANAKAARVASPSEQLAGEVAALRQRIGELERAIDDWRCIAVAARAEAQRHAEALNRLREDNARLRANETASVIALRTLSPEST